MFDWGIYNTNRLLESSAILKANAPQSLKARAVLAQMPEAARRGKNLHWPPICILCNLGGELIRRKIPVEVLNFEWDDPMAADFQRLNVPVHCQDHQRLIFEDRLAVVLRGLSRFQPTVVLANLSATSFEVLRYLPAGVSRVGVGQSDHPTTYEMMRHYAPHMDLLAVVSETMKRKAAAMPDFSRLPVACLPYGVPIPPDEHLAARRSTTRDGEESTMISRSEAISRHRKTSRR